MTSSLSPLIIARDRLSPETRESMFTLHARHFAHVERARFMTDLDDKQWVILLRKPDGGLAGFSTQTLMAPADETGPARFLFSGDTIIAPEHWNTPYLAGCFGHLMLRLIDQHRHTPIYWFLISKGFRTYRFLPVFFIRFWPAPDRVMPPDMRALLSCAARLRFGTAFDAKNGIIRMRDGDRLIPELAQVPPSRLRDPAVAFFLRSNPGYVHGDELACLAPVTRDNLNAYADRVIRATTPEWQC